MPVQVKRIIRSFAQSAAVIAALVMICGARCPSESGGDNGGRLTATMIPEVATVLPGGTRDYVVSVLPRGDFEGTVVLKAETPVDDVTCTPSTFTLHLNKGETSPRMETIRVFAFATAPPGRVPIVIRDQNEIICEADVEVLEGGEPGLTFTASPASVSASSEGLSVPVTFTLASAGGFRGDVTISFASNSQITVDPNTNNFVLNVVPGAPATFTRRFARNATHSEPIRMVFTARNGDGTIVRTATVTVNDSST